MIMCYLRIKAVAVNRYSNIGLLAGGLGLATRDQVSPAAVVLLASIIINYQENCSCSAAICCPINDPK